MRVDNDPVSLRAPAVRSSQKVRLLRLAKGTIRVMQKIVLLPTAIVLGRRGVVRALRYICLGTGNAAGVLGLRYQQYRHPDGC